MSSRYSPPQAQGCTPLGFALLVALWVAAWYFESAVASALGLAQLGVELYVLVALACVGLVALAQWALHLVRGHRATSKS